MLLFSILLFIVAGFIVLGAIGFLVLGAKLMGGRIGIGLMIAVILYLGMGALYAVPALFLGKYSSSIGKLAQSGSSADLEAALEAQRSFWKFAGIVALVIIGINLVSIVLIVFMHPS